MDQKAAFDGKTRYNIDLHIALSHEINNKELLHLFSPLFI